LWRIVETGADFFVRKKVLVSDYESPIVLSSFVAEKLAPFQYTDVEEVSVGVHKELVVGNQLSFLPASLVERQIAEEVAAENSNPTE
jgi:hypothetical protein